MPWSKNTDLPEGVRNSLPASAQTRWRQVANSAMERGASEQSAIRQAWHVVGQGWKKPEGGKGKWVRKAKPRTLYVRRNIKNADSIIAWAKEQGLEKTVPAEEMHVTLAFSKDPVDWMEMGDADSDEVRIPSGGPRLVDFLGPKGAVVLHFSSYPLSDRHQQMKDAGASWDWEGYQPHITLSYQTPEGFDPEEMEPYRGPILLGPEIFEEVKENWSDGITEKAGARHTRTEFRMIQQIHDAALKLGATCEGHEAGEYKSRVPVQVFKIDEGLGLIFGWAIVSKIDSEDYYDLHGDHIPEATMLKASTEFMELHRLAGDMHQRSYEERVGEDGQVIVESVAVKAGQIIFAWPMTSDIAKAMGLYTRQTGLMIAMKPDSKEILDKYRSGEYTGFSIGGSRVKDEEIEDG